MANSLALCAILAVMLGASSVAAQCNYYSCYSCISLSNFGCGWTGYSCQAGSSSGPYYATTSTWYYYSCSSYIVPGWSTGSYYVSYGFWSVSSWGLWLCVAGFVLFWGAVCSCCFYRRRRVYVATTTISQPLNAPGYVVGVQQTTYAPQQVTYAYGQPGQPGPYAQQAQYGQPAPQQQAQYGQPAPQQQAPYGQPAQVACQPAPAPQPTGGIYGA